jgi:hypothetical protein
MEEHIKAHQMLPVKHEEKRHRHEWKENIKVVHINTLRDMDWIHLAQDRIQYWGVVSTVMDVCSMRGGEFRDHLIGYKIFKKHSAT